MNIRKYLTIVHKRSYVFDSQVFDDSDVDDLEGFPRIHPRLEGRGLLYAPAFWPTRVTTLQGRGSFRTGGAWVTASTTSSALSLTGLPLAVSVRVFATRWVMSAAEYAALLRSAGPEVALPPLDVFNKHVRRVHAALARNRAQLQQWPSSPTFRRPTRPRCGSSTSSTWPTPCVSGSRSTTTGAPRRPCRMSIRGEGLRAHWTGALSPGLRWRQRTGARAERLLCLAFPPLTVFSRWAEAGREVGPGACPAWPPLPPTSIVWRGVSGPPSLCSLLSTLGLQPRSCCRSPIQPLTLIAPVLRLVHIPAPAQRTCPAGACPPSGFAVSPGRPC